MKIYVHNLLQVILMERDKTHKNPIIYIDNIYSINQSNLHKCFKGSISKYFPNTGSIGPRVRILSKQVNEIFIRKVKQKRRGVQSTQIAKYFV